MNGVAEHLSPAELEVILHRALGIPAEHIGTLEPGDRGIINAEVLLGSALRLITPLHLTVMHEEGPVVLSIRRPHDTTDFGHCLYELRWTEGPPPSPSALIGALSELSQHRLGSEALRAVTPGHQHLLLEIDAQAVQVLPESESVPLSMGRHAALRRR